MKLLSNELVQQVSGGTPTKAEYENNTSFWAIVGFCTAAASMSLIPAPYVGYFAVRMAALSAGAVVGYAFGAIEYSLKTNIRSSIDHYLAPEQ